MNHSYDIGSSPNTVTGHAPGADPAAEDDERPTASFPVVAGPGVPVLPGVAVAGSEDELAAWIARCPDGLIVVAQATARDLAGAPAVVLAAVDEEDRTSLHGTADAAVLAPSSPEAAALLATALSGGASTAGAGRTGRAASFAETSMLSGDAESSIAALAHALGAAGAGLWFHGQGGAEPDGVEVGITVVTGGVLRGRAAAALGVPLIAAEDDVVTTIAVTVSPVGSNPGVVLAMTWSGVHLADAELLGELRALAGRLAAEARVLTVQQRLLAEHERLRETAMLDAITGAWNRAAFERAALVEVAAAGRRGEPLSLVVLDVIGLSKINDRHGHRAGDAALAHVASIVRANVRVNDEIGRVGDDEIALLLVNADAERSLMVANKLVKRITERPALYAGIEIPVHVRVGVTQFRAGERSYAPVMARATAAMASARPPGGAVVYATQEHGQDASQLASRNDSLFEVPAGTVGGAFRMMHELSRGATGVVYRGEDIALGRAVAIKVLRSDLARNRPLVERFRREAQVLASLRHANLVQVFSFGVQGDDVYLVMELVEGPTLEDLLDEHTLRHEVMDLEAVCEVVSEIADALDTMHGAGLVHRDVKPANIIIDRVGERAVLVDVGAAKRAGERVAGAGTPGFAAPESFAEGDEGLTTDVYGLASTAYTLLTGRMPHGHGDALSVLSRQLDAPPPPPSALRRGLPTGIDDVILRALSVEPTERYSSAGAFALALTRALSQGLAQPAPRGALTRLTIDGQVKSVHTGVVPQTANELGQIRGAAFRVAGKVLAHRLGEAYLRRVAEGDLSLAYLLRPTLAPASWTNLGKLIGLLEDAVVPEERITLARTIGRGLVSATFQHLFGADPNELTTDAVLGALPAVWPEYLDTGRLELIQAVAGTARFRVIDCPQNALVVEIISGMLQRVAESTGADDVEVTPTFAEDGVWFDLGWSVTVD